MIEDIMIFVTIIVIILQIILIFAIMVIALGNRIRKYNIKKIYELYGIEVNDDAELETLLTNFELSEIKTKILMFDKKIKKEDVLSVCIDVFLFNFLYKFFIDLSRKISEYAEKHMS